MKLSKKRRDDLNAYCNCCVYNNREDTEYPCGVCKHNGNAYDCDPHYGNKWVEIKIYRKFKAEVRFKGKVYKINSIYFNKKGILKNIGIYTDDTYIEIIKDKDLEDIELVIKEIKV